MKCAGYGPFFGYPECCIEQFEDECSEAGASPAYIRAETFNLPHGFAGFIPCDAHMRLLIGMGFKFRTRIDLELQLQLHGEDAAGIQEEDDCYIDQMLSAMGLRLQRLPDGRRIPC